MQRVTSRSGRSGLDRRTFLRAVAFTALAVPTTTGLVACTSGYEDTPDPLRPLWLQAEDHAKAARRLAAESTERHDLANTVATLRSAQAKALRAEVERLNRPVPDESAPATAVRDDDLFASLAQGRDDALALLPDLPRHRAGLVGAVAAGCAAALELGPASQAEEPDVDVTSVRRLEDDTAQALQTALGAEHAAVWVYGLVRAFLDADYDGGISRGERAHLERRDRAERLLTAAGRPPRPAEPAYVVGDSVTDPTSAARAVATAENDAATAWHGVLERTDDTTVRTFAVQCLLGAATRGVHWRDAAGLDPRLQPLPGRETTAH
jgi:hypothetical protein